MKRSPPNGCARPPKLVKPNSTPCLTTRTRPPTHRKFSLDKPVLPSLTFANFFKEDGVHEFIWDKGNALVIRGGKDYFESVLAKLPVERLDQWFARANDNAAIYLWMNRQSVSVEENGRYVENEALSKEMFPGHSEEFTFNLLLNVLSEMEFGRAGLKKSWPELQGDLEGFISKKGHVTKWHTDQQYNFTMQLRGTKTWELCRCNQTHALVECKPNNPNFGLADLSKQLKTHLLQESEFDLSGPSEEPTTVTLHQGDLLFFPCGMWHKVTSDTDSISLNIALTPSRISDLLTGSVRTLLSSEPETRAPLGGRGDGYEGAVQQADAALNRLRNKLSKITARDLVPPVSMDAERCVGGVFKISATGEITPEIQDVRVPGDGKMRRNPLAVCFPVSALERIINRRSGEADPAGSDAVYSLHHTPSTESLASRSRQLIYVPRGSVQETHLRGILNIPKDVTFSVQDSENRAVLNLFLYVGYLTPV